MNGYELTQRLRKARRRHHLSAPTQALYYELIAICNEEEWVDVFKCSNDELTTALNISEKSLTVYRQELINAGLIFYRSGQSKKKVGTYSFAKEIPLNGCKIYNQSDNQSDSQSNSQSDNQSNNQSGEIASDLIKTKTETKEKPNSSKSHSGVSPGTGKKVTEHWKKLVETWFCFYKEKFSVEPSFEGGPAKNLKIIAGRLQSLALNNHRQWTEDCAVEYLSRFLNRAYRDDWLRANFLLSNLATQYDKILNSKKNGTHSKHPGEKPVPQIVTAGGFGKL